MFCSEYEYLNSRVCEELERASSSANVCARDAHLELARLFAERLRTAALETGSNGQASVPHIDRELILADLRLLMPTFR